MKNVDHVNLQGEKDGHAEWSSDFIKEFYETEICMLIIDQWDKTLITSVYASQVYMPDSNIQWR